MYIHYDVFVSLDRREKSGVGQFENRPDRALQLCVKTISETIRAGVHANTQS
jgi:hypothetical protein